MVPVLLPCWHSLLSLTNWQGGTYGWLINWGVLLHILIYLEVHLFSIYFLHQKTWILEKMNLFFSLVKVTWVFMQFPVRIKFSFRTVQPMSTTWPPGKKELHFYRTPASGCFWSYLKLFINQPIFEFAL